MCSSSNELLSIMQLALCMRLCAYCFLLVRKIYVLFFLSVIAKCQCKQNCLHNSRGIQIFLRNFISTLNVCVCEPVVNNYILPNILSVTTNGILCKLNSDIFVCEHILDFGHTLPVDCFLMCILATYTKSTIHATIHPQPYLLSLTEMNDLYSSIYKIRCTLFQPQNTNFVTERRDQCSEHSLTDTHKHQMSNTHQLS